MLGGLATALLLLSACGGSDGPGSNAADASLASGPVSTSQVGSGTVLVDAHGRTLYFTDQDRADEIACVEACAQIWIALTVPDGTSVQTPAGLPEQLGVTTRPDGASQVTYGGKPLYTFRLDPEPGAVTGDGLTDEFGSTEFTWHAALTEGSAPATGSEMPGYNY